MKTLLTTAIFGLSIIVSCSDSNKPVTKNEASSPKVPSINSENLEASSPKVPSISLDDLELRKIAENEVLKREPWEKCSSSINKSGLNFYIVVSRIPSRPGSMRYLLLTKNGKILTYEHGK